VLESTFIHVPGIGQRRERELWEKGFTSWERFLGSHPPGRWYDLIASRLDLDRVIRDLPKRELWRSLPSFGGRTAYLDIETEGLDIGEDAVTCIGLSDGRRAQAFVRGRNLSEFPAALRRFDLLVTYNGACFDLPVLKNTFPSVSFDRFLHVDLRYPAHRVGLQGGLKAIEHQLGLSRAEAIDGADGYLAVLLWREHRRGHPNAVETLAHYCLADVVSLKPLAVEIYNRLARGLPLRIEPLTDVAMPPNPHRPDGELVRRLIGGVP
jgi:uncharacterized protein YprB with RNaseH-like and TPR domain